MLRTTRVLSHILILAQLCSKFKNWNKMARGVQLVVWKHHIQKTIKPMQHTASCTLTYKCINVAPRTTTLPGCEIVLLPHLFCNSTSRAWVFSFLFFFFPPFRKAQHNVFIINVNNTVAKSIIRIQSATQQDKGHRPVFFLYSSAALAALRSTLRSTTYSKSPK